MASADGTNYKKPRGRSPSYPGIDLQAAIDRARTLYDKAGRHRAPVDVIIGVWGYTTFSGSANVNLAALKKFGLIDDEGSGSAREAWLTDLALDILLDTEPRSHIQRAALTPPIHREMWDQYGVDLPHDNVLRSELIRRRGFTEKGADDFISEWRATLKFSGLASSPITGDDGEDEESEDRDDHQERSNEDQRNRKDGRNDRQDDRSPRMQGVLTIPVPIINSAPVVVEFPGKIAEDDWNQFIAVLTAMKPGIVAPPDAD